MDLVIFARFYFRVFSFHESFAFLLREINEKRQNNHVITSIWKPKESGRGEGANCFFLGNARFYHSSQLDIIFIQHNSLLKGGRPLWGWPARGGAVISDHPPLGRRSPVEDPGYTWSYYLGRSSWFGGWRVRLWTDRSAVRMVWWLAASCCAGALWLPHKLSMCG